MSENELAYLRSPAFGCLYLHKLKTDETENDSLCASKDSSGSYRIGRHVIGYGCLNLVRNIIRKLDVNYSARSQVQRVRRMAYSDRLLK
jgi:hypothetical protein